METMKSRAWTTGIAAGVLLAIFLLVISLKEFKTLVVGEPGVPATNVITVSGKGETVAIPDIATFSFSVTETEKTVADAQAKATTKINAAIDALKGAGVAEKDIKTVGYNINPHYEYSQSICTQFSCPPSKSTLTGYEVSQSIEVKVRDLSKAGQIFTLVGGLGVQNVNSLAFSIDDIDTVQAKAQEEAINDAKEKAQKLAHQLGVGLIRIVSFSDVGTPIYRPYAMDSKAMGVSAQEATPPQVPQGEQKITSNVTISYEIR